MTNAIYKTDSFFKRKIILTSSVKKIKLFYNTAGLDDGPSGDFCLFSHNRTRVNQGLVADGGVFFDDASRFDHYVGSNGCAILDDDLIADLGVVADGTKPDRAVGTDLRMIANGGFFDFHTVSIRGKPIFL
jgi:hypothetical protein